MDGSRAAQRSSLCEEKPSPRSRQTSLSSLSLPSAGCAAAFLEQLLREEKTPQRECASAVVFSRDLRLLERACEIKKRESRRRGKKLKTKIRKLERKKLAAEKKDSLFFAIQQQRSSNLAKPFSYASVSLSP